MAKKLADAVCFNIAVYLTYEEMRLLPQLDKEMRLLSLKHHMQTQQEIAYAFVGSPNWITRESAFDDFILEHDDFEGIFGRLVREALEDMALIGVDHLVIEDHGDFEELRNLVDHLVIAEILLP